MYDEEWYDPEEWDDVRVLNWDSQAGRRKRAYTRRKNIGCYSITRYKNNYYVGYLTYREVDDTCVEGIPREFMSCEVA